MWFLLPEEGRFHNVNDPLPKKTKQNKNKKNHQNIHPQLINMTLQEGLVIKDI
jgi:hypothetical protein